LALHLHLWQIFPDRAHAKNMTLLALYFVILSTAVFVHVVSHRHQNHNYWCKCHACWRWGVVIHRILAPTFWFKSISLLLFTSFSGAFSWLLVVILVPVMLVSFLFSTSIQVIFGSFAAFPESSFSYEEIILTETLIIRIRVLKLIMILHQQTILIVFEILIWKFWATLIRKFNNIFKLKRPVKIRSPHILRYHELVIFLIFLFLRISVWFRVLLYINKPKIGAWIYSLPREYLIVLILRRFLFFVRFLISVVCVDELLLSIIPRLLWLLILLHFGIIN